jgi:hypothetical protein
VKQAHRAQAEAQVASRGRLGLRITTGPMAWKMAIAIAD